MYFAALKNGEQENFFGSVIADNTVTQTLTLRNLDSSAKGDTDTLEVAIQGVTSNQHLVKVSVNGSVLDYLNFSDRTRGAKKIGLPYSLLREGSNTVALEGDWRSQRREPGRFHSLNVSTPLSRGR